MKQNIAFQVLRTFIKLMLRRGIHSSYSQRGEDLLIQSRNVRNGFYVDVGAYHPILYSNTYGLYKRGWRGLVIDPNITMLPLYSIFRPRDTFVGFGVGAEVESIIYYKFNDGAYNTFDKITAELYKQRRNLKFLGEQKIEIRPLKDILKENNVCKIDFMNIDVEGLDLVVLKSHDWSILPNVIAVEDSIFNPDTPQKSEVYTFLREKRYTLISLSGETLIFEHEK